MQASFPWFQVERLGKAKEKYEKRAGEAELSEARLAKAEPDAGMLEGNYDKSISCSFHITFQQYRGLTWSAPGRRRRRSGGGWRGRGRSTEPR